jgi:glycosyltransferase involved in cell wall biosynthesis
MKKIKNEIIFILVDSHTGGAQNMMKNLMRASYGRASILTINGDSLVFVYRVLYLIRFLSHLLWYRKIYQDKAILLNMFPATLLAPFMKIIGYSNINIMLHSPLDFKGYRGKLVRFSILFCNKVMSVNDTIALVSKEKKIYNVGICFSPSGSFVTYDKSFGVYKILMVSRLDRVKRHNYAIEIVKELYNIGIKVNLDIYGDGPEFENIREQILKNKSRNLIKLCGYAPYEEIKEKYHLMLITSEVEGFPLTILESINRGIQVFSTPVGVVPNLSKKISSLNVIPLNSPIKSAYKIKKFLKSESYLNFDQKDIDFTKDYYPEETLKRIENLCSYM